MVSEVPQNSAPEWLFAIYTHSLGEFIKAHAFKHLLYADDSHIFIFSQDLLPEFQT